MKLASGLAFLTGTTICPRHRRERLIEISNYEGFSPTEYPLTSHVAFGLHPGFGAASFESFRLQMPPGCYRRYFLAPAIISLAKCGTSIFPVGKCRFPEMNCQDPASWSLLMCRSVNSAMSIRQAGAG